jgi:hypothetical protein
MDKRRTLRLDKAFPVAVSSPEFGVCQGIARNISTGGMFIEICDPLPLGCAIRVHFSMPGAPGEIVARAEVRGHYFLNFNDERGERAVTGMGVKFTGFVDGADGMVSDFMGRHRTLH